MQKIHDTINKFNNNILNKYFNDKIIEQHIYLLKNIYFYKIIIGILLILIIIDFKKIIKQNKYNSNFILSSIMITKSTSY